MVHTSAGRSMPSHARHETAQQSRNYSDAVRLGVSVQGDRHRSLCGGFCFMVDRLTLQVSESSPWWMWPSC